MSQHTQSILASQRVPEEGIFWYINGELIYFLESENTNTDDLLHKKVWRSIQEEYKVNGKIVPYNYFPRGRVTVSYVPKVGKSQPHYDCTIYCDKCIRNDKSICDEILEAFDLAFSYCNVDFGGVFSFDGTHYTCHKCR